MAYNVNVPDTDLIDLGDIILDLNELEVARLIENGGMSYVNLMLKNGHSHVVPPGILVKLKEYCRQN